MATTKHNAKQLKQSVVRHDATSKIPAHKPEQMKAIGRQLVATAIRAENTVRDALVALMGKSPQQLTSIKEGIREAWQAHRSTIGAEEEQTERTMQMMAQAVYNRQSEQIAICTAFAHYAGMDTDTAAEFKSMVDDAQNYHKLVELCRHVNRVYKGEPLTIKEIAKANKQRGELRASTLKAIEKNLKLASIDQLKQIIQDAQARLRTIATPAAPTLATIKGKKVKALANTRAKLLTPKGKARKAA